MAKHCRKNGRKKICLAAFLRVSLASHVLVVVTFGQNSATFLDASTHLYIRVCPWSVRGPSAVFFKLRNSSENALEMIESLLQSNFKTKF